MATTEGKLQKKRDARDNDCNLDAQEYKSRKKKKEIIEDRWTIGLHTSTRN
jgi:hypothetical protein